MSDINTVADLVDSLPPTHADLIQRKWRLEAELAEVRREMQSRDACAVDEICNLKIGEAA